MRIDHLGIATDDLDATGNWLAALVGAPIAHEEEREGLRIAFIDLDGGDLELLEPTDDAGPVARFLDDRGPGIHHVGFRVDDVSAALEHASSLGLEAIDQTPRAGARGHDVAFLHPSSTGGVLIEFVAAGR